MTMPTGNWIMVRKVKGALSDKEPAPASPVVARLFSASVVATAALRRLLFMRRLQTLHHH
jgi:hypothetical protein